MSPTAPSDLPQGLVTFLFTDVAGSTRLWENAPEDMRIAMADHDHLIESAVTSNNGQLVRPRGEGDSRFAVFWRASDALAAATDIQLSLATHSWPTPSAVRVRAAVHTGEADLRDGDYYGRSVNRAARLRAVGHPGQVLVSGAAHDVSQDSLPPGITLRPLGTVELADLERPEPVYQVQHDDLAGEFPALRASGRPVVKLPPLSADFLGRDSLVDDVGQRLTKQGSRLVTLTGPGGVGKTQLAVAAALGVRDQFSGGVFFVSLADVTTSGGALYALAAAVEVREANDEALVDTVCRSLSSAPALLVLDNGEQVEGLDALVAQLLTEAADLAVITTSRSPLRLRAEHRVAVPSLDVPGDDDVADITAANARDYAAVELFTRRTVAVDSEFVLDQASLPAVIEICRRLDGSPLSLELAAARADILDVHQIAERLGAQLTLLSSAHADLPPRQRTARATIEWSTSLLRPDERETLLGLCVMNGPFSLEDAEAMGENSDATAAMSSLVDSSLIQTGRTMHGRVFRATEAVREYARSVMDEAQIDTYRRRLLTYVTDVAGRWSPTLNTSEAATGADEIRRRYEDVRASIAWATEHEQPDTLAPLLAALRPYWLYDGQLSEPLEWLERWLDAVPDEGSDRPSIELAAGVLSYLLDDAATSTRHLHSCLESDDSEVSVLARGYLGAIQVGAGEIEAAAELAAECERDARDSDYEAHMLALSLRAVIAVVDDDTASEREHYLHRLELARNHGDERRVAETLNNLAEVCLADGDLASAEVFSHEALPTSRRSGRIVTRDALYTQARLDLMREDAWTALVHARESLQLSLDLGQRFEISQAVTLIGATAIEVGRVLDGAQLMAAGQYMRSSAGAPLDVNLEPELETYRERARRELGSAAYETAMDQASTLPADAVVQLGLGILPTR